ncbi:MAG: cytochrome c oxidase subunit I [Egibacteraceae bacterium]
MTAIADKPSSQQPSRGRFSRPTATTGWASWLTTTDHKKIGILYFFATFFFFLVGGLEALVIRSQLAGPAGSLVTSNQYSQIFTMHGLTMIFFVVMPMGTGVFGNYLMPIMIGARDVAFPRLNALSFWVFVAGGVFLYSSALLGGTPDGSWVNYASLQGVGPDPENLSLLGDAIHSRRMLFYSLGLQIAGIASLATAVNFVVTILNMRAPGMTLMRMPVFVWMTLVTAFLLLFAMPVIGVALWMVMFDVGYAANFFRPEGGGDPVLWQHLFWLFGHPEVYIMVLPAFGIVSEVLPVFSRKPLFGYAAVVFSGIAIGFIGWGVWAHHMFTTGLGPIANAAFGITSMIIAVPTGIKIFNWIGTLWGGHLKFHTPMLFAIGLVSMFTIGGLSGVTHAVVPANAQQHDTYYVVAHFHYVLFGGAIFGLFAGVYYWFPKATGRLLRESLGKIHFWMMLIGFNLTFGPQHILGLNGMPRRIYTYESGMGWDLWNLVSTIGAFVIALSILVFLINLVISIRAGAVASDDPWDARTLEWTVPSPPPQHNFDVVPTVTARDELWHRKYAGKEADIPKRVPSGASADHADAGAADARATAGAEVPAGIHLPDPSYWPLVLSVGLPIAGWGVIFGQPVVIGLGLVWTLVSMLAWALEPSVEESH